MRRIGHRTIGIIEFELNHALLAIGRMAFQRCMLAPVAQRPSRFGRRLVDDTFEHVFGDVLLQIDIVSL